MLHCFICCIASNDLHKQPTACPPFARLAASLAPLPLACTAVDQQLAAVAGTDILIGMHGAALTYAFLLSPHAALVELWPQVRVHRRG